MSRKEPINLGYQKYNLDTGRSILKPVILVELQKMHGKEIKTAPTLALIDSGADYNIFQADLSEILFITDLESGEYVEIGGIAEGDKTKGEKAKIIHGWRHAIGINVRGRVRGAEAVFSPNIADCGFSILGQEGFFDKFEDVRFGYKRGKITIKP